MCRTGTVTHFDEMYIGIITMEINMKVSQKIKNRTTIRTTSSYFHVFIWRKQKVKIYIYAPPWLLLSTGKKWQQLTCQLMGEWIKKMIYIQWKVTQPQKKKKRKKEFLPFATIWVTFEGANVKWSKSNKDTSHMIPHVKFRNKSKNQSS